MTVNPRHANNGANIPTASTRLPGMLLKLPIEPNPAAPGSFVLEHMIANLNGRMIPHLILTLMGLGSTVQMGILKDGFNDQEAFETWLKKIVDQTKFEVVATLMRPAYVGDGVLDTAINRLQTCKQKYVDENGRAKHWKVEQHFLKFMSIVVELDSTRPYNVELPYTFLNSLADTLKNKIIRQGYHPPRRQQPTTAHADSGPQGSSNCNGGRAQGDIEHGTSGTGNHTYNEVESDNGTSFPNHVRRASGIQSASAT